MIRKNTLNYKLNLTNHSTKLLYEEFLHSFRPEEERCPFCNAKGNCRPFASYERHVIDFCNGNVTEDRISILRVRCSCGHSHAVLTDSIVPYRQYSLPFILQALQVWFSHSMTPEQILDTYGVSRQLLAQWKNTYGKHKDLWLGMVRSRQVAFLAFLQELLDTSSFSGFTSAFYRKTLYSFLQSHVNPANCRLHPPGWTSPGAACT